MSDNTKLLENIYEGAQMGRDSIGQLMKNTHSSELRRALKSQQQEYQLIMDDAEKIMKRFGTQPQGLGALEKISSQVMTGAKTLLDDSTGKIAEMMIQGSTMGTTKLSRSISDLTDIDSDVEQLSKRLLKTEEYNIEQMKKYL